MLITWASQQYKGSGSTFQMLVDALFASGAPGAAWGLTDPARLWTDTAGTTPAGMGDYVARVDDLTGRGQHLLQGALPSRPQRALLPNGKPALLFDGVDDFLSLASLDLSMTNKITVFVGLRKMVNSNSIIAETSTTSSTVPGSFRVSVNGNFPNLFFLTGGSSPVSLQFDGNSAPLSAVLTATSDIAAPRATLAVNGGFITSATSQGTGNYGSHPLYVCRRGGTSLPFSGYLTHLVILGRIATAEEIAAMGAVINAQIGAY